MISRQTDTPPLVSVVVTVYKRVQFLRGALQSVLRQTFRSFDIIVTDDSNNLEIKSICDSFQQRQIHYRYNPSPLGVACNLRAAISETSGRYIAILNDDDLWEPDFLALLLAPLQDNPERVLAFGDHWIIGEDGRVDYEQTEENTLCGIEEALCRKAKFGIGRCLLCLIRLFPWLWLGRFLKVRSTGNC
jgi:glycosyltransferase involved in cell wall biosynthesis